MIGALRRAWDNFRGAGESAVTESVTFAFNAVSRANFIAPRMLYGRKISVRPASAITSASPSFCTVIPLAPSATCHLANCGSLWVLMWGLSA